MNFEEGGPEEGSAQMREFARLNRDMYVSLMNEGFTQKQALYIVGTVIAAQFGKED